MYFRSILIFSAAACLVAQQPAVPPPKPEVKLSVLNPASPPAPSLPPDTIVITIGEEKISLAEFDQVVESLPDHMRKNVRGRDRRQFAETLVRMKLLAREASKHKLDESPAFRTQLAFQRENVLANLEFQNLLASTSVEEADLRAYYEQHKTEWQRVHARHILVRIPGSRVPVRSGQKELTDEEALAKAREIRKKLSEGADFAALSTTESDDVGTGVKGGDLGFFSRGQMVPAFDLAAFSLPPGEISEPVKSPFGYHIIKVEQKEAKSFEEIRSEIENRVRPQAAQKVIQGLQRDAGVSFNSTYFGN